MLTLYAKFQKFETEREVLLNLVKPLALADLHHKPQLGKWSVAQIMEHLRVAEKQVFKSVKRNLENQSHFKKAGILPGIIILITKFIFKTRIKLKAPKFVSNIPEMPDFEYLQKDWNEVRAGFQQLSENFPPEMEDKLIFRHPILGRMTIHHILDFMFAHFSVHRRQILKIYTSKKPVFNPEVG